MDVEPESKKRRRISTRIKAKEEIIPMFEKISSKENNHEQKEGNNEDLSSREGSGPLHLRFDDGTTKILCKSGSFRMKECRKAESYVTAPTYSNSVSSSLSQSGNSSALKTKDEEPFENEGESVSEILMKKFGKPSPLKKYTIINQRKKRTIPKRQAQKKTVIATATTSPEIPLQKETNSHESVATNHKIIPSRRDTRITRKSKSDTTSNTEKEHPTSKFNALIDEKSWADKTALSQGAQCNAIQVTMIDLLRSIRRKCDPRGFFSAPVDPIEDECPDYFDIIDKESEAMDLGTIEVFVRHGKLRDMKEFESYINRIYKCAIKYNSDSDHFVNQKAKEFYHLSKPLMEQTRLRIIKMNGRRKSSLTGNEAHLPNQSRERISSYKEIRSDSEKQNIVKTENVVVNEDMSFTSLSSKADSEFELLGSSSKQQIRRNLENNGRRSLRTRNKDSQRKKSGSKSNDKRQTRKQINRTHYKDETSDSEMSDVSNLEDADIPYSLKDLSESETKEVSDRKDWLSLCPKLVMVCNEAARRATLRSNPAADRFDKPLSETYIKERLQLGFPLRGHTIWTKQKDKRSPIGLQGFVVTTNFITWKQTLRFCMDSPAAGLTPIDKDIHIWDDGSITQSMKEVPRFGEVSDKGIVFSRVAEIALLGGLGCGSSLLRKALQDLQETGEYDFVLLQATKNAIPFYQRHGFVRIGAVARFNDEMVMPEIAYRHWSEISDGEVVEASYMMARHLPMRVDAQSDKIEAKIIENSKEKKSTKLHEEISSSLLSAKKLLLEAINLKMSLSQGGRPTFYELLSLAREFGKSADDTDLVHIIDRATKQSVGYTIQHSKSILRSGLNFPSERCSLHKIELRDIKVNVNVSEETKHVNGVFLKAVVPSYVFTNKISREKVSREFVVRISCNNKEHDPEREPLYAIIPVLEKTNRDEAKESTAIAFHSIRKIAALVINGGREETWDDLAAPNDSIMLQTEPIGMTPIWMNATIERKCLKSEVPNGSDYKNTFFVKLSDGGTIQETLDRSGKNFERGVGRKWCSTIEWSAFSSLPVFVLDMFLLDASVKYIDINGRHVEGVVSERIGGGLNLTPKWRVMFQNIKRKTRSSLAKMSTDELYKDLDAGTLRDFVIVDDEQIEEAMVTLAAMGTVPDNPENLLSTFSWKGTTPNKDVSEFDSVSNIKDDTIKKISKDSGRNGTMERKDEIDQWVLQRMEDQMLGKFHSESLESDVVTKKSDTLRSRKHIDRLRRKRNIEMKS